METKNQTFESLLFNELITESPEIKKHDQLDSSRFDSLSLNESIREKNISPMIKINDDELSLEQNKQLKFNPPLYLQRYDYVMDLLKEYKCKTFMDIGAAECKMLRYLKNSSTDLNLIIGLDIDEYVLYNTKEKFAISWFDYIQPKDQPIEVYLIQGDISEPCPYFLNQISPINMNIDFVSMVEIIEHLYPDVLAKCIETVFSKIKPKVVLMTTPNQEFNIIFDQNKISNPENPNKFRHWDHKFEWTRLEFQTWCQNEILNKYPDYELVFYDGLGMPPEEFINVGHCTQTALFRKKQMIFDSFNNTNNKYHEYLKQLKCANYKNRQCKQENDQKIEIQPYFDPKLFINNTHSDYKIVSFTRYPFELFEFENIETRNQAIINELNYLINFLTKPSRNERIYHYSDFVDPDNLTDEQNEKINNNIDIYDEKIRIASLEKLFSFSNIQKFRVSNEEMIQLMRNEGFQFTNSGRFVFQNVIDNVSDYYESERENSFNENYENSQNSYDNWKTNDQHLAEENWDDDEAKKPHSNEEDWDEEMLNSSNLKSTSMIDESLNTSNQVDPKVITPREQFEDVDVHNSAYDPFIDDKFED